MRPFLRTIAIHTCTLLFTGGLAVACYSGPDGTGEPAAESTEQALTIPKCPAGYVIEGLSWDTGPNGQPIASWECQVTAAAHTTAPASGYADTCGTVLEPVPADLPSTCTPGTQIDGAYVFACPAGTPAPARLVLTSEPNSCNEPSFPVFPGPCEDVVVIPSKQYPKLESNCLGNPVEGWELIVDVQAGIVYGDGGSGGACPGGCAIVGEGAPLR
jgi:hypothetical protein